MELIIVIVGFLGAGKTTLLKRLTKEYLGKSWDPYIILNDYQNASMDSQQFLSFLSPSQVNALSGSCICCSGINVQSAERIFASSFKTFSECLIFYPINKLHKGLNRRRHV